MPLTKLQFKPGINREVTSYSNEGGWRDCDKIRFRFGFPEKIGGWEKYTSSTYLGTARALHNWIALDGANYLGIGSHLKYYIEEGGNLNDITPVRRTTSANGAVSFSATHKSSVVTVTDAGHGAAQFDYVTFSNAESLGGNITSAVLNKEHQISRVIDADNYEITTSATATTSGILTTTVSGTPVVTAGTYSGVTQDSTSGSGTGATFTVVNASGTYVVTVTGLGVDYAVSDTITILGTQLGGLTPANDLVITVASIGGDTLDGSTDGVFSLTGTTNAGVSFERLNLLSSTQLPSEAVNPFEKNNPVSTVIVNSGTSTGAATFTGVTGTVSGGSGVDAEFTITTDGAGGYTVDAVTNGGTGYDASRTITILGTDLGGTSPTNDLVLDIDTVVKGTISKTYNSGGQTVTVVLEATTDVVGTTVVNPGPPILYSHRFDYSYAVKEITAAGSGWSVGDSFTFAFPIASFVGFSTQALTSSPQVLGFDVATLVNNTVGEYQVNVGLNTTVGGTGWGAGLWSGVTNTALQTTLNEGATLAASDTTITLTSTSGIVAGDVVFIGTELILVGGISGNDLTSCTRGHSGTTATTHADGSVVQLALGNANPADDFSGWGQAASGGLTTTTQIRLWSHDNFGEDLLLNPRDDKIYYWDRTNNLSTRAVELNSIAGTKTSVPTLCKQILVSDRDRHVIAFGSDGLNTSSSATDGDGTQDPLLIRFSDQENPTEWYPTSTNTAGDLRLGAGSTFVQAVETKREILVWTDTALTSMRFIGPPFTFGLQQLSSNITIMSPNSAVSTEDFVFWMGIDTFYVYAGQTQTLPCTVKDKVFLDFNLSERDKVVAGINSEFSEVTWFYPSANSSDNDRYVTYNYSEKVWYFGTIERTAWLDRGTRTFPLAVGDGYIYNHEFGYDDDGSAMDSFIESAAIDIGDGDRFTYLRKVIPDLTFDGSTNLATPQATFTVKARNNPGADFDNTQSGTATRTQTTPVEEFTEQLDLRVRGRSFALRVESNALGSKWKLGSPRVDIRQDGRR